MTRPAALCLVLALACTAHAGESLAGKACRSVHLGHDAPPADVFVNQVRVLRSAPGSYFMVCGWSKGYFGIQEQDAGKKVAIFSVWDDAKVDDPNAVPGASRVKLLYRDPKVRVGRFGGEGTGGQSFLDLNWRTGESYRMAVTVKPDGAGRAAYTGWLAEGDSWRRLVTFSTPAPKAELTGLYSFIEDFKRNGDSLRRVREAEFGPGWSRSPAGKWTELRAARFTGDGNPSMAIRTEVVGTRFRQATGGDVSEGAWRLNKLAERESAGRPPGLPAAVLYQTGRGS